MSTPSSQIGGDQQALTETATPAPRVRVRAAPAPVVHVRQASAIERAADSFRSTILSEETLVLLEFLIIMSIGIVAFITVFPTMKSAVDSMADYLNKQFSTSF